MALQTEIAPPTGRLAHLGKEVFSVGEAARILSIGRNTAYTMAADGTMPTLRLRGCIRVPRWALEQLLESAGALNPPSE